MKNSKNNKGGKTNGFVTKSAVRNMIQSQVEQKRIVQVSTGTVTTAGTLIYYSSIAQGDDKDARAGDKILIKSCNWTFAYSDTLTGVARIMLLQDTSNLGAAPAVTDVLSSATVQAHLNPLYHIQNRFKVLADETFTTSVAGEQYINRKGSCKIRAPIYFSGTGSSAASGGKNAVYLLIIGGQAVGGYVVNIDMSYTDA